MDFSKEFEQRGIPLEPCKDEINRRELHELERFFGMNDEAVRTSIRAMAFAGVAHEAPTLEASDAADSTWAARDAAPCAREAPEAYEAYEASEAYEARESAAPESAAREPSVPSGGTAGALEAVTLGVGTPVGVPSELPAVPPGTGRGVSFAASPRAPECGPGGPGGLGLGPVLPRPSSTGCTAAKPPELAALGRQRLRRPVTERELAEARAPVALSPDEFPPVCRRVPLHGTHYDYFSRQLPGESPDHRQAMRCRTAVARRFYNYPGPERPVTRGIGTSSLEPHTASQAPPGQPSRANACLAAHGRGSAFQQPGPHCARSRSPCNRTQSHWRRSLPGHCAVAAAPCTTALHLQLPPGTSQCLYGCRDSRDPCHPGVVTMP